MSDKYDDNNLSNDSRDNFEKFDSSSKNDGNNNTDKNLISWSDTPSYSYDPEKIRVSTANSHYSSNNSSKTNGSGTRGGNSNAASCNKKAAVNSPSSTAFVNNNPPKNKMDKGLKVFLITSAIILGSMLLIFSASLLATFLKNDSKFRSLTSNFGGSNGNSVVIHTNDIPESTDAKTAEQIYQEIAPSIVGVVTYNPSAGLISTFSRQGSGIIISEDGYVVTNSHVIGNTNKYNVSVVTSDRKEFAAKIIGFDQRTDIAVLKIDATGLKAAEFGNSDQLAVGASVLAIGNPGGLEFSNSLTRGVISALNRDIASLSPNANKNTTSTVKYIQTDAAINPGNSGGALLNMYGQVIGINNIKLTDYEAMGLAIPSNTVTSIVSELIKNGYVSGRVKMGISVRALSAYEAQLNNVPQGLLVLEIAEGSSAGASGLRVGDIIIKFGGVDTRTTAALYNELSNHKPGETVNVSVHRMSVLRNEEPSTQEIPITLTEDKGETQ